MINKFGGKVIRWNVVVATKNNGDFHMVTNTLEGESPPAETEWMGKPFSYFSGIEKYTLPAADVISVTIDKDTP